MNNCDKTQTQFTERMDGRLSGREMQRIDAHIKGCRACAKEWKLLEQARASLAMLGPVPEPEDLLSRIRVAISQERVRRSSEPFYGLRMAWKNAVGPFLFHAAAGFASAVLLMVIVLVGMFAQPVRALASADEPLGMATAPRFLYLSSAVSGNPIGAVPEPIVIEAYVNGTGLVYDYRILSGPTDEATRAQVENMLLWTCFEPARRFGLPVRGTAVLSYSGVSVHG